MSISDTEASECMIDSSAISREHLRECDVDIVVTLRHQLEKNKYRDILAFYA
jgi:hypothetical protein